MKLDELVTGTPTVVKVSLKKLKPGAIQAITGQFGDVKFQHCFVVRSPEGSATTLSAANADLGTGPGEALFLVSLPTSPDVE